MFFRAKSIVRFVREDGVMLRAIMLPCAVVELQESYDTTIYGTSSQKLLGMLDLEPILSMVVD